MSLVFIKDAENRFSYSFRRSGLTAPFWPRCHNRAFGLQGKIQNTIKQPWHVIVFHRQNPFFFQRHNCIKHRKSEEKRKVNRKFVTILIGSLCKLNVELVWLVYGHVATWSESSSVGEGLGGRWVWGDWSIYI